VGEAVVVSAVRSPFGKAYRGSLTEVRPDDLSAQVVDAALARVPELSGAEVADLLWGCAVPSDEHGDNIARRVAVQLGLDGVPGVTVNRFCASSVQTARMAMHQIRAGEGSAFVVGGVDCVSRYVPPSADTRNPLFAAARARTAALAASGEVWTDPREMPWRRATCSAV
jgi:acetyl-CoA C-acetyltransferase